MLEVFDSHQSWLRKNTSEDYSVDVVENKMINESLNQKEEKRLLKLQSLILKRKKWWINRFGKQVFYRKCNCMWNITFDIELIEAIRIF